MKMVCMALIALAISINQLPIMALRLDAGRTRVVGLILVLQNIMFSILLMSIKEKWMKTGKETFGG